jgi:hypothetical protein
MIDKDHMIKDSIEKGIIEAIGDGISIQDTNFKILYQNTIHKNLLGDHIDEYCYKAFGSKITTCEDCLLVESLRDGFFGRINPVWKTLQ